MRARTRKNQAGGDVERVRRGTQKCNKFRNGLALAFDVPL